ncbi:MAG TPA: peptidylprolyl isomerase [Candidatus Margulisiibacteriota bacterium]|nr:peptidylprolyl isomerase [Candidatus Margulisiibacteriota bacterium]
MTRRATTALTVALLFLPGLASAERINQPMRDEDVVARVNGTAIYRKQVKDVVQGILLMQDKEPDPGSVAQLANEALDSLIALELLYQESQTRGIKVSDADVDAEINRSKKQFPDAQSFQAAMKARSMTENDLRRDTRKTMAVSRFLEGGIWKNVTVPPEQIKSFYDSNKDSFQHPEQIRVSHILVRVPEAAGAAERAAAKQRASALLDQLKAGADFAALARKESQDASSAAQGGDLGFLAKGEMDSAFEKYAFALKPGQLSDLVTTPYGFDIIKVTERRGAGYTPLPEVEEQIRALLEKSERQKRQADLVAELRKKAKVEVLDQ